MAQRVEIYFEDDLTGGLADGMVTFGIDGASYEIDLNSKNKAQLEDALAQFISAARKTGARTRRAGSSSERSSGPSPADVRSWARDQGIAVKDKGRVPAELIIKFQAAGQ